MGCSTKVGSSKVDYESSRTLPALEVPPDLSGLPPDTQASTTAGSSASATYSSFEREQKQQQAEGPQYSGILPEFDKVRLVRAGAQRWLVVNAKAEVLWPQVLDFLDKMGLTIAKEKKAAGIVETNWAENRAGVASKTQRVFSFITGQGYGTGMRDKYRVRLERGEVTGTTEIYLTHRGMVQMIDDSGTGTDFTGRELGGVPHWQPRPSDPELESEMLRLLMVHLGTTQTEAKAAFKEATPPRATLDRGKGGAQALTVKDKLDTAWRRVGVSLDSIGYVVEDRDRAKGVYFVRDINQDGQKRRRRRQVEIRRYQVVLKATWDGTSVRVLDEDGNPKRGKRSAKVLAMLYERLK
ncbi:MAG: outer membrane protein assembly factor BamC [Acidiferrobacterales bacterium]